MSSSVIAGSASTAGSMGAPAPERPTLDGPIGHLVHASIRRTLRGTMRASTGARSAAIDLSPITQRVASARAELEDPTVVTFSIATLTIITFALVRLTGGAPNAVMELGFVPVLLGAYAFGARGGAAAGVLVAAALGP